MDLGVAVVGALVALLVVGLGVVMWTWLAAGRGLLEARLDAAGAELRRLADAGAMRDGGMDEARREVTAARQAVEVMLARDRERRVVDEERWVTLQRVAAVLAGSVGAGRTGENVLREALAHLPPSMLVRDFRVNGKVVEFGLVLPDGRRMAIDSKWPAERELEALSSCTEPGERERLARAVERQVTLRVREVAAYRDPGLTAPLAVAAVPDAAYAVLRRAHAEAYRSGVLVVSYSMALPVVLFLHGVVARYGSAGDVEACLTDVLGVLDGLEACVENKVAKAATMLANGSEEMRGHLGKARTALARVRQAGVGEVGDGEIVVAGGQPNGAHHRDGGASPEDLPGLKVVPFRG